jgi:hypothetical protein
MPSSRLPFLEEDGFRELAAEFGNPDELLAYPRVRGPDLDPDDQGIARS